jgi:hypothetical protein
MDARFRRILPLVPLLLALFACGGSDGTLTTASRVPSTPTASATATATHVATPTATAPGATATPPPAATATTPPAATATTPPAATATTPPAATATTPPAATATTPPAATATATTAATPAPSHGQCNFSQPGSFTCVIPAGVPSVSITATGGGGGGGDACCNDSGGFTGLGGTPGETGSTTAVVPSSGQTLVVTVGSGGLNGQWVGDPATRGGHGAPSEVADGSGGVLLHAPGGPSGTFCAGAHRSGLSDGQRVCGGQPAGTGGLGGDCFTSGTTGCSGSGGTVTISW